MATCSVDKTVKIWDINEDRCEEPVITFTDIPDFATSIRWSPDGKMIGVVCKNKAMAYVDPRQEGTAIKAATHTGSRQVRMNWVDGETVLTTGFDQQMKRQWGAWDLRNMEQPLMLGALPEGSGVSFFHFDREYNIGIMMGRGDNTCPVLSFNRASP
jgi:WD40 repeat protein